jgi:hypothetical protein
MFNTIVTWKRDDKIMQSNLLVDIQEMDVPEARNLQAVSPADAFWIYANFLYDFQKGDVLEEEKNPANRYRVFARARKTLLGSKVPTELIPAIAPQTVLADQLRTLIGHMYRQPNGDDIAGGLRKCKCEVA